MPTISERVKREYIEGCKPFYIETHEAKERNRWVIKQRLLKFNAAGHPGQIELCRFAEGKTDARICIYSASSQVGKSVCLAWCLYQMIMRRGFGQYLVVAPTIDQIQSGVGRYIDRVFGKTLDILGKVSRNPKGGLQYINFNEKGIRMVSAALGIEYETNSKGEPVHSVEIYFRHTIKKRSLLGYTAQAVIFDEAGDEGVTEDDLIELIDDRTSDTEGPVILASTPHVIGPFSEMYERYAANPDTEYFIINSPRWHRPGFNMADAEAAKKRLSKAQYSRRYLGLPMQSEGAVWTAFDSTDNAISDEAARMKYVYNPKCKIIAGIDPGSANVGSVKIYFNPEDDTYCVFEEHRYKESEADVTLTFNDHVRIWTNWTSHYMYAGQGIPRGGKKAGSNDHEAVARLRSAGLKHARSPKGKSVTEHIKIINQLFADGKIFVNKNLFKLIVELKQVEYDKSGKPNFTKYHTVDGFRYGIVGHYNSHYKTEKLVNRLCIKV